MPEGLPELLQGIGPLGAFCLAVLYLLVRDHNNKRPANGNDIRKLERSHRESVEIFKEATYKLEETCGKLNMIHEDMRESNGLLHQIIGRLSKS